MIQYVQKMIQYLHTEMLEDDPDEIDDEDVWWCSKNLRIIYVGIRIT